MRKRIKLARPSHTTVVAYLTLILVISGGAAYAAGHLAKNSVGAKQLKKNSVTTAKIKKNAVTAAKIKKGSVNGAKVKDGSLTGADVQDASITGADVNAPSMPFGQVVHKARGSSTLALTSNLQVYPLDNPTYTQAANEDDGYVGAVDLTLPSTCAPPRFVIAELLVDAANPTEPEVQEVGAVGEFSDHGSGTITGRLDLGSSVVDPSKFEPGTPKNRTLTLVIEGSCSSGSGITASFAGVDVIGVTS